MLRICSELDARLPEASPPLTPQSTPQQVTSAQRIPPVPLMLAPPGKASLHGHAPPRASRQARCAAAGLCRDLLGSVPCSARCLRGLQEPAIAHGAALCTDEAVTRLQINVVPLVQE